MKCFPSGDPPIQCIFMKKRKGIGAINAKHSVVSKGARQERIDCDWLAFLSRFIWKVFSFKRNSCFSFLYKWRKSLLKTILMLLIWETMDRTLPTIIQVSWSKLLGARVGGQGEFSRRFTSEQMSFFQWQTLEIFRKIENKWMLPIIVCSFPVLIIKIRENWKVGKGLSRLQESLTSWRRHKFMGMDLTPFK